MLEEFRLAPRLGHCHDLQQVAVRVLEVETVPAPAGVDLAVGVAVWATAVGDPLGRHPGEDRLELRLADMERVVMALARPGVEPGPPHSSGSAAKSKVRLSVTCTCAKEPGPGLTVKPKISGK